MVGARNIENKNIWASLPLISIIVPIYKSEKYIDRCIESVISQTYFNWELLLINDGSPDNSGMVCDVWSEKDNRIKVFHKENGGVSSARNFGIEHAVGEWVTFIDSDDWISANYLESFIKKLEHGKNTIYLQGIQMFTIHKGLSPMFSYTNEFYSISDHINLFTKNRILANGCPVAKLFNHDILTEYQVKFDETISINEDHLFVLTYYNFIDNVCTISDISYYYYYDFTVPSLTKINRSYSELHRVSSLIFNAYERICSKLMIGREEQLLLAPIFGPNQAMEAILSCISNNEPISIFSRCCEFMNDKFGYALDNYGRNYKPYLRILSFNVNTKVKYHLLKWICTYKQAINIIKYKIKIFIWHSHIRRNKL